MLYYATFTTGLHVPITALAEKSGACVRLTMDGALLYEAAQACLLPCFNNTFGVLKWQRAEGAEPLPAFMKKVAAQPGAWGPSGALKKPEASGTFRLMASVENKLTSVSPPVKKRLEQIIAARTGLAVERGGLGEEFWFMYRREGYVFFMRRLTTHTAYEKTLQKGELHPEIAYMLHVLSEPEPTDTVWDPFCGYGALPVARLTHFPCRALYASDTDEEKIRFTRQAIQRRGADKAIPVSCPVSCRRRAVSQWEPWLTPGSVDKIVTDPPWGMYGGPQDLDTLYGEMLAAFARVVRPGGLIVVLTAQKDLMAEKLTEPSRDRYASLTLQARYDVLISGKKAGIFVIRRA